MLDSVDSDTAAVAQATKKGNQSLTTDRQQDDSTEIWKPREDSLA